MGQRSRQPAAASMGAMTAGPGKLRQIMPGLGTQFIGQCGVDSSGDISVYYLDSTSK